MKASSDRNRSAPRLAIVTPCYNEEEVLQETLTQITTFLADCEAQGLIAPQSYMLCVDDGSKDSTWALIANAARENLRVRGIKLSRNVGHQLALMAGLSGVRDCEAVVSIDADLQDELSTIKTMLDAWREGYDVVYGVRNNRTTDTYFKRKTAGLFYSFMRVMGVQLVPDHADFRLMDRRALDALLDYKERNLFLRGIVPLVGFPSTEVYYARLARQAGESKYPLRRMIALAVEGITSFSVVPLRAIAMMGIVISALSCLSILYVLMAKVSGYAVKGWASIVIALFFMGGVQMFSLGIIGEYIGKIYWETKDRPRYHVEETTFESGRIPA